jgi:UDP:flavonoid glycosyltransferase YjiC (YdhE family)
MAVSEKPLVLICCTPVYGHLMPIRAIAKELVVRGYEVTFVTGSAYRKIIEEIGASLVSLEGFGDFSEADLDSRWPVRKTVAPGLAQYVSEHNFLYRAKFRLDLEL